MQRTHPFRGTKLRTNVTKTETTKAIVVRDVVPDFEYCVPATLSELKNTGACIEQCNAVDVTETEYAWYAKQWNSKRSAVFNDNTLRHLKSLNEFLFLVDTYLGRFTLFDPSRFQHAIQRWAYHLLCIETTMFTIEFDTLENIFESVCRFFWISSTNPHCARLVRHNDVSSHRSNHQQDAFRDAGIFYRVLLHARQSSEFQSRITKYTATSMETDEIGEYQAVMSPAHGYKPLRCDTCRRNLDSTSKPPCLSCPMFERKQGHLFQHLCDCKSCIDVKATNLQSNKIYSTTNNQYTTNSAAKCNSVIKEEGEISDDDDDMRCLTKAKKIDPPSVLVNQLLTAVSQLKHDTPHATRH